MKSTMRIRIRRGIIALTIAVAAVGGALISAHATAVAADTPEQDNAAIAGALYSGLVATEQRVTVLVNGGEEPRAFYGEIIGGVTYVPVLEFADAVSAASVTQDGAVSVMADDIEFKVSLADKYFKVGDKYVYVAGGARERDGVLMVPVRVLAEAVDANVGWNAEFRTVLVGLGKPSASAAAAAFAAQPASLYTEDDLLWMARIINAEARGECFEGKLAVGNVIMNRIASDSFPDTVYKVIFDGIQFTPALTGAIYNNPTEECYAAADIALRRGADIVGSSLYFANTTNCWAGRTREYFGNVGAHYFFI